MIYKKGMNRIKDLKERKKYATELCEALYQLLQEGFNPFLEDGLPITEQNPEHFTLKDALLYAFENKKHEYKERTAYDFKNRIDNFLLWARDNGLTDLSVREFKKIHAARFLNKLAVTSSGKTVNNYRAALSAMMAKLAGEDIIDRNFITDIPKRKENPNKNRPFTAEEIKKVKGYLMEHDPYLFTFMRFIAFAFMRNTEVIRMRVGDVYLKEGVIRVETKTEKQAVIPIIEPLRPVIEQMRLETFPPDHFIFTPQMQPGPWDIKERDKVTFFGKRFTPVKKTLGLHKDHTIYSLRHTFAVDIYNNLLKNGHNEREAILKMLPITRHTNETGLKNYLRKVAAFIPKDYSNLYTIDF
ncbi:tyrosine-type recombinase/integrase [Abyssalbus ytuae]|uniref:Site-specific integrase n=1 Tax=Abyssalbus ytuae TaxID=2926907 RepID=A0A9E6ZTH2_9FLAO|nr:tyrosine-type recombinase/integrase [Abyssalbus ytuae]UOB18573.1 site-specific integrase [Abyssalbus ytuae]